MTIIPPRADEEADAVDVHAEHSAAKFASRIDELCAEAHEAGLDRVTLVLQRMAALLRSMSAPVAAEPVAAEQATHTPPDAIH